MMADPRSITVDVSPGRLWFGLLAAPAAWVVQGLCGWALGARICQNLPVGRVRLIVGLASLGALAVAIAAVAVGLNTWRRARTETRAAEDRVEFMSFGGVLVSTAFTVGIFWASLNAVFVRVCGESR